MTSITTRNFPRAAHGSAGPALDARSWRQISFRAGRALSLLNHAIEYIANEFLRDSLPPSAQQERLQAIRILMSLNRQVLCECPEIAGSPTFRDRCRQLFGSHTLPIA